DDAAVLGDRGVRAGFGHDNPFARRAWSDPAQIHDVTKRSAVQIAREVVEEEVENVVEVTVERYRAVWGQVEVGNVPQRARCGQRFLVEDVENGGLEVAGGQRVDQ